MKDDKSKNNKHTTKIVLFLILVCLLQIPLILPFLKHGFFPTHDNVQVVRIFEFYQSLVYGKIPPSWSSGLLYGHGYPIFSFYSPLVYLIGSIFAMFGINFLVATKLTFILAFFIGAIGFFLLAKHLYGFFPALLSTIIYSLAPYRAVDVYVRGNLAEFFALSLFPFFFLYNFKLLNNPNKKNQLILAIIICLQILTHNISVFIYLIFISLYNLFYLLIHNKKRSLIFLFFKRYVCAIFMALGISAFYWFPLLLEMKYVILDNFAQYPYDTFYISLSQLWKSPWGYGGFHQTNPMSLQLGQVLIVSSLFAFIYSFFSKNVEKRKHTKILAFLLLIFSFLEIKQSYFIWKNIPILSYIQFPWRIHIVTTTITSILTASLIYFLINSFSKFKNTSIFILSLLIIILSIKESYKFFTPKEYTQEPAVSETTTWDDEYLPKWVLQKPKDYAPNKVNGTEQTNITNLEWGYHTKSFSINLDKETKISLSHIFYPGWTAYIDNVKTDISYNNPNGLMEILIPIGSHKIEFIYQNTWWRSLSQLFSVISILLLIFLIKKNSQHPQ